MRRTQIMLGEAEMAALDDAGRRTGASRGELIRRAVIQVYAPEVTRPRCGARSEDGSRTLLGHRLPRS